MLGPSAAQLHVEQVLDLLVLSKRQLNNEEDSTSARTICVSLSVAQLHVQQVLDLLVLSERQLNNEQDSTYRQCCGTVTIFYGSGSGSDF